jgi:5-methyltetrahydrofolate--homocysteine methyltransferase
MDTFFNASRREFTLQFLLEKPVDEVLDYYQARLENAYFYGDAWPKWIPYFGPGIGAGLLGGRVAPMPEQRTVWFEADKPIPYDQLHFTYDPENVWWRRILALTREGVERWGNRVVIAHTDIGGILDILASFRTTYRLLSDLYENPEEVLRCTAEIRTLWMRFYDEFYTTISSAGRGTSCWAPIWSPGRTYMHQCDFSYMISPKMFERFVLPDLDFCFRQMEHAFYHLDGIGQIRHLDMLLSLKSLAGIQWVPGAGQPQAADRQWFPLLRRIRNAGKLCQLFVTAADALSIIRELGGSGFALMIGEPMTPEDAQNFVITCAKESGNRSRA